MNRRETTARSFVRLTRCHLLDRTAPTLCHSASGRHDQHLTEWVGVPCRPGARLESDAGALNKRRVGRLKKRIDTYRAGEPLGRSLRGRLGANSLDVHFLNSFAWPISVRSSAPAFPVT